MLRTIGDGERDGCTRLLAALRHDAPLSAFAQANVRGYACAFARNNQLMRSRDGTLDGRVASRPRLLGGGFCLPATSRLTTTSQVVPHKIISENKTRRLVNQNMIAATVALFFCRSRHVAIDRTRAACKLKNMPTLVRTDVKKTIGEISNAQLDFLVEQFEEEADEVEAFYVTRDTLEALSDSGADSDLLDMLETAMGDDDGMDIRWD